jgi:hypothetical protein
VAAAIEGRLVISALHMPEKTVLGKERLKVEQKKERHDLIT